MAHVMAHREIAMIEESRHRARFGLRGVDLRGGLGAMEGMGTYIMWMAAGGLGLAAVVGGVAGAVTKSWKVGVGVGVATIAAEGAALYVPSLLRRTSAPVIAPSAPDFTSGGIVNQPLPSPIALDTAGALTVGSTWPLAERVPGKGCDADHLSAADAGGNESCFTCPATHTMRWVGTSKASGVWRCEPNEKGQPDVAAVKGRRR